MNRLRQILKDRRGVAFPLIIAIVLVLVMLMCCISEYFRLLIVAQGVRDAVQEAVISTVNDNYDDVYHGVREGYSGAYQPLAGDFEESLDYGDIPSFPTSINSLSRSTESTMGTATSSTQRNCCRRSCWASTPCARAPRLSSSTGTPM